MTTLENPRELRGLAIISKGGDAIARVSDVAYSVKSQSGEGRYAVAIGRTGNWYCECPDFAGRNVNLPNDDQEMRLVRKVHAAFQAATEEAFPRPVSTLEEEIQIAAAAKMCAGMDVVRLLGLPAPRREEEEAKRDG